MKIIWQMESLGHSVNSDMASVSLLSFFLCVAFVGYVCPFLFRPATLFELFITHSLMFCSLVDTDEMRSMQEFDVNTEDADGSTIPMLQSITLAIDSNYDFPYACLYRFRVHGEGELMIDDPEYE